MDKAKIIKTKPGNVTVVDEMRAFLAEVVVWFPVAADCKDVRRALLNRDNVWERNPRLFACVFVFMLIAFEV